MTFSPAIHALIGCGRVGPNHADAVHALGPQWELRWACDRDAEAARRFATEYGASRATESAAEVFADPEVVSVSIAVDHAQHAQLVEQALRAGKHVLVEKPLALSGAHAGDLIRMAADRGLVLSVVSQHVYDPLVEAVSGWLAKGLLGRVLYVRAVLEAGREESYYTDSYWRGRWPGEGGSALVNQGYHCLDVLRRLCGGLTVTGAVATAGNLYQGMHTEDTISALFSAHGVPATMTVTVGSATMWRTRLEFVGTAGTVEFDIDHPAVLHRAVGSAELEKAAAVEQERTAVEEPPGVDYYGVSHRRQMADFARAVGSGGPPMACSPEDGVAMVDLLADIYDAAGLASPMTRTAR